MKTFIITALIALTGFAAQAQVAQTRRNMEFSKIYVRDGIEVILTQGKEESVRVVAATEHDLDGVMTESDGNTLRIYMDHRNDVGRKSGNVKVYVTQEELKGLKAGSGAAITIDGEFKTLGFALDMAAGSSFKGKINSQGAVSLNTYSGSNFNGVVTAEFVDGDFKSGSTVKLAGFSRNANIQATSGATCVAPNFICDKAVVDATEHGTIIINVKESITASADETSTITYYGSPQNSTLASNSYALAKK